MPNMSYCRFENTSSDLDDCLDALRENSHRSEDFSDSEKRALKRLMRTCRAIVDDYEEEVQDL